MLVLRRSKFGFAGLALVALCCLIKGNAAFGNDLTITWRVHKNTSIDNSVIEGWHSLSTTRLCTDDDGTGTDDRSVATSLTAGTITGNWDPNDPNSIPAVITMSDEADRALAVLPTWGGVVTSITWGGGSKCGYGLYSSKKLLMAKTILGGTANYGVALAHEVGHNSGITVHNTGTDFIMSTPLDGTEKYVSAAEKTKYEALAP